MNALTPICTRMGVKPLYTAWGGEGHSSPVTPHLPAGVCGGGVNAPSPVCTGV